MIAWLLRLSAVGPLAARTQTSATPCVTPLQLLKQAWCDWTDKEVQAGYTWTYIWMANQMGHLTLGLLSVFSIYLLEWLRSLLNAGYCRYFNCASMPIPPQNYHFVPYVAAGIWALKEYLDVQAAKRAAAKNPNHFPPDLTDLWRDAGTAVYFLWSGILLGSLGLFAPRFAVPAFLGLLLIGVVVFAWYWLIRKFCFQRAQLPFLSRLADFSSKFSSGQGRIGVREVLQFVSVQPLGLQHILVFGKPNTGRSTLAVAIATERCFDVHPCRYFTWAKFLELNIPHQNTSVPTEDQTKVWPWKKSDIVVLDDVFVRSDVKFPNDCQRVQEGIRALAPDAICGLRARHVVWVLGPLAEDALDHWKQSFSTSLNMIPSDFGVIELAGGYKKPKRPMSSLSGR